MKESTKSSGGWFSAFTSLVGNRKLTREDVEPALAKMRDALIGTFDCVRIECEMIVDTFRKERCDVNCGKTV